MKNKILLTSLCLLAITQVYAEPTNKNTRSEGWYGGISMGVANTGGSITVSDGSYSQTFDEDTEDSPKIIKIGKVTKSENRIEAYLKKDSIGDSESKGFDTTTFGLNYQWGISSLSTEKMLPYIRVGAGIGKAKMEGSNKEYDAGEFGLGAGVHYEVTENMDISTGVYRRAIAVTNNNKSIATAFNGFEIGVNYHFLDFDKKK